MWGSRRTAGKIGFSGRTHSSLHPASWEEPQRKNMKCLDFIIDNEITLFYFFYTNFTFFVQSLKFIVLLEFDNGYSIVLLIKSHFKKFDLDIFLRDIHSLGYCNSSTFKYFVIHSNSQSWPCPQPCPPAESSVHILWESQQDHECLSSAAWSSHSPSSGFYREGGKNIGYCICNAYSKCFGFAQRHRGGWVLQEMHRW